MKDMMRMKASKDPRSQNQSDCPRERNPPNWRKRRFNILLKQPPMKPENLQLKKT